MIPTKIDNHKERAADRTLSQYDDSARLKKLIEVIASEYQDIEDLLEDFFNKRNLSEATGVLLDVYGLLLGWPRWGFEDTEYRDFLRIAIQINISDGTAHHIADTIASLTGRPVQNIQKGKAHYELHWSTDETISELFFFRFNKAMEIISPMGVSYAAIQGPTDSFMLDSDTLGLDQGRLSRRVDIL